MAWRFERVAGPFEGPAAGLAWDGAGMLFSILSRGTRAGEGRILRFDPKARRNERLSRVHQPHERHRFRPRRRALRLPGALAPHRALQPGRVRLAPGDALGRARAQPADQPRDSIPAAASGSATRRSPLRTSGPLIYPQGDSSRSFDWNSIQAARSLDVADASPRRPRCPRAIALSPDEHTLYVADRQGLHAFAIRDDALDARRRLSERALSGLNVRQDGRIVACAGASLLVLEASGAVRETWPFPGGESVNCAFGGQDLYVTTTTGELWRGRP